MDEITTDVLIKELIERLTESNCADIHKDALLTLANKLIEVL